MEVTGMTEEQIRERLLELWRLFKTIEERLIEENYDPKEAEKIAKKCMIKVISNEDKK